jgi:hypothetical protein
LAVIDVGAITMNEAETFLLVIAPLTIIALAAAVLLAFRVASRRFAARERQLLDQIAAERAAARGRDEIQTSTAHEPTRSNHSKGEPET